MRADKRLQRSFGPADISNRRYGIAHGDTPRRVALQAAGSNSQANQSDGV